ncbi:MAG: ATP-binding protein [Victivallales bacterium]
MNESETIEFKKGLAELKEGIVSIAAILNKHGEGRLWFGIRNCGKAVGVEVNEKTLRDLSQSIAAHIEPRIYPRISHESLDGKTCIEVFFRGKDAPYFAYGRCYMRVADEDRQLSSRELENLILAKNRKFMHWDGELCNADPTEINENKLKHFVERSGLEWDTGANALKKLGLFRDGKLNNAAILFFAKTPSIQLRCAVFAGTSSANIIDRHDYEGDILELIEEAQKYILKNIHIGMRVKGLYREDIPEISPEAMREVIINAFCHRDYRDPDHVQVAIFKNRVEIRNPGELFDGLTMKEVRKGNISKRRNPLIADLLRRIQMVESWGRGMPFILKEEPKVQFKEVAKIFIASFPRPSFNEPEAIRAESGAESGAESALQSLLSVLDGNVLSMVEISLALKRKTISGSMKRRIRSALADALIERTISDRPNSRLQKYRLTEKGRNILSA